MSVTSDSVAKRKRLWYLLHVLAFLGAPTLVLFFGLAIYVSWADALPTLDLPVAIRGLLSLGFIALLWLWVRMLVDFFRERPRKHPVAWGWFMFLGMYVAGLAYFLAIWRPRNSLNDT
jgi:hypothetical protein